MEAGAFDRDCLLAPAQLECSALAQLGAAGLDALHVNRVDAVFVHGVVEDGGVRRIALDQAALARRDPDGGHCDRGGGIDENPYEALRAVGEAILDIDVEEPFPLSEQSSNRDLGHA